MKNSVKAIAIVLTSVFFRFLVINTNTKNNAKKTRANIASDVCVNAIALRKIAIGIQDFSKPIFNIPQANAIRKTWASREGQ